MPLSKYYKGKGEKVMREMKKRYGKKKGESVFYATANKSGMTAKKRNRTKKKRAKSMAKWI